MSPRPERRAGALVADDAPESWISNAFGITLRGEFVAPGLPPTDSPVRLPPTVVEVAERRQIEAAWPHSGSERVLEESFGGSRLARTIDRHPEAGHRLYARHFGLALVSADGRRVLCAPPGAAHWRWQRFLIGRILPWAALERGLEVLHASAVAFGDAVVAFIAPTGGGKTSLAMRLVLDGASFLTDDVLAVERADGGIVAHPGAAIASIRPAERVALGAGGVRRLGSLLGHSDKTYVTVQRESRALPLAAVYLLVPDPAARPGIERVEAIDPRVLLASTFIVSVTSPARLANLLELCADLSASVPVFRASVVAAQGAAGLAESVRAHLRDTGIAE